MFLKGRRIELAAQLTGRIDIDASSDGTILKLDVPIVDVAIDLSHKRSHIRIARVYGRYQFATATGTTEPARHSKICQHSLVLSSGDCPCRNILLLPRSY
jgi:hypothetical protein